MTTLPHFASLDELIEFWETHDLSDHWNELEEVAPDEAMPGQTHRVQVELPLAVFLDAVGQMSLEDARQIYDRLGERLGHA